METRKFQICHTNVLFYEYLYNYNFSTIKITCLSNQSRICFICWKKHLAITGPGPLSKIKKKKKRSLANPSSDYIHHLHKKGFAYQYQPAFTHRFLDSLAALWPTVWKPIQLKGAEVQKQLFFLHAWSWPSQHYNQQRSAEWSPWCLTHHLVSTKIEL